MCISVCTCLWQGGRGAASSLDFVLKVESGRTSDLKQQIGKHVPPFPVPEVVTSHSHVCMSCTLCKNEYVLGGKQLILESGLMEERQWARVPGG